MFLAGVLVLTALICLPFQWAPSSGSLMAHPCASTLARSPVQKHWPKAYRGRLCRNDDIMKFVFLYQVLSYFEICAGFYV